MATTKGRSRFPAVTRPRRVILPDGTLVLPPVALCDLPPDGVVGSFMGIAAVRFTTKIGNIAVFLHDLEQDHIEQILTEQRIEAEAQLGRGYGRRALWWELLR